MTARANRGFTLVELLIVIGIVAVVATVTVLVLNPSQLLKQSRDARRISDLAMLKKAIGLYIVDRGGSSTASIGDHHNCYIASANVDLGAPNGMGTVTVDCGTINRFSTDGPTAITTSSLAADGSGWLPVDFTSMSVKSPLSVLPSDPSGVTSDTYYYAYQPGLNLTYELNAVLESAKYAAVMANDGGNNQTVYEVGNDPNLDL